MARPREFDIEEALDRAVELFWLKGFHATTTRELDSALGIGHQSLYNAFGDKASLFARALEHYRATEMDPRIAVLEASGASKRDIVRFFAGLVDFHDAQTPRKGCMIFNVAVELAPELASASEVVTAFSARLERQFARAVSNAVKKGDVPTTIDAAVAARGLLCSTMGLAAAARAGTKRDSLVDMASNALRPLY